MQLFQYKCIHHMRPSTIHCSLIVIFLRPLPWVTKTKHKSKDQLKYSLRTSILKFLSLLQKYKCSSFNMNVSIIIASIHCNCYLSQTPTVGYKNEAQIKESTQIFLKDVHSNGWKNLIMQLNICKTSNFWVKYFSS